jgi:hypothetical protein
MSTVDALTDQAMVVLQDRPLVALAAWLVDALDDCAGSGRTLQLVTPLDSRLSLPLRTVVAGQHAQWVVRDGEGYYEGLTGRPMQWSGGTFVPVPEARDYAPGFTTRPTAPIGAQLALVYRSRHGAEGILGGAVDRLIVFLSLETPGFSPGEESERPAEWDKGSQFAV